MGIVIDLATRRQLKAEAATTEWTFGCDYAVIPEETLIFEVDPLPNSMTRIVTVVPNGAATDVMRAFHSTLLATRAAKVAS